MDPVDVVEKRVETKLVVMAVDRVAFVLYNVYALASDSTQAGHDHSLVADALVVALRVGVRAETSPIRVQIALCLHVKLIQLGAVARRIVVQVAGEKDN
jgi:hypothetical protein